MCGVLNGIHSIHADDSLDLVFSSIASDNCEVDFREAARTSIGTSLHTMVLSLQNLSKSFPNTSCWSLPVNLADHSARNKLLRKKLTYSEATRLLRNISGVTSQAKEVFCIPKVYMIGYPKCGSTTIRDLIERHPQVVGRVGGERWKWTEFPFVNTFPQNFLVYLNYLAQYRVNSHYIQRHPNVLAVDGRTGILWSATPEDICETPRLFTTFLPNGRYIVIMRDPVPRLYSSFTYFCALPWTRQHKSIPQEFIDKVPTLFHEAALGKIREFEGCLENFSVSFCTQNAIHLSHQYWKSNGLEHRCRIAVGVGLYYVHLARWLSVIPRDQFLFLRTEDLARDPYAVMNKVWKFLGLKEQSREKLGSILHQRLNVNPLSVTKMRSDTLVMLQKFYQPFNRKLADLLDDDKFLWSDITT